MILPPSQNLKFKHASPAYFTYTGSQAYQSLPQKELQRPWIYLSPMGSGKTHLIKLLIQDHPDALVIAPYRSCMQDLGLALDRKAGLNADFMYTTTLLNDFADKSGIRDLDSKPTAKECGKLVMAWLKANNTFYNGQPKLFIIDEIDFLWWQCKRQKIVLNNGIELPAIMVWNQILFGMAFVGKVKGFTATNIPSVWKALHYKPLDVMTSVRIPRMHTSHYSNVRSDYVLKYVLNRLVTEGTLPTLFYKTKWTKADMLVIKRHVDKHKLRVLMILRKENAAGSEERGWFDKIFLQDNAVNVIADDVDLTKVGIYYALVEGKNAVMDTMFDGEDVHSRFHYVFINTSSSRQVSIKRQDTPDDACRVICFGKRMTSTMLQVAGRYRENPVHLYLHLWNNDKADAYVHQGEHAITQFQAFDKHTDEYHLFPEGCTSEWLGNLGAKTSPTTQKKKDLLDLFLATDSTVGTKNQRFNMYQQWVKKNHPDTTPYSKPTFYKAASATTGATA